MARPMTGAYRNTVPCSFAAIPIVIAFSSFATAQVNCEAMPAGPARTDCYIGLSRVGGQNAAIAGSKARIQSDQAMYRQATGTHAKTKSHRKKSTK